MTGEKIQKFVVNYQQGIEKSVGADWSNFKIILHVSFINFLLEYNFVNLPEMDFCTIFDISMTCWL